MTDAGATPLYDEEKGLRERVSGKFFNWASILEPQAREQAAPHPA